VSDGRLTIRFSTAYQAWIAAAGGDKADAVRALMVLGAAALDLPGSAREAVRLLESDLNERAIDALLALADKRQTSGRQVADKVPGRPVSALVQPDTNAAQLLFEDDPLGSIGIEV